MVLVGMGFKYDNGVEYLNVFTFNFFKVDASGMSIKRTLIN